MNSVTTKTMFSSASGEWSTPQDFFDELDREFHFGLDAAATRENSKCRVYMDSRANALIRGWHDYGPVWLNPPYGRGMQAWFKKAYEESLRGITVVMLVPSRTDTAWFHDYVQGKAEVRFVRGRLKFGGQKNAAPFPSMVVIYRGVKK